MTITRAEVTRENSLFLGYSQRASSLTPSFHSFGLFSRSPLAQEKNCCGDFSPQSNADKGFNCHSGSWTKPEREAAPLALSQRSTPGDQTNMDPRQQTLPGSRRAGAAPC